jgi:hypothetical protein
MMDVADLIVLIVDSLPISAGGSEHGLGLDVTALDVAIPIEARIDRRGRLVATPPRGRMTTGFAQPLTRITAHFDVRGR